jgi:hypothetical protein
MAELLAIREESCLHVQHTSLGLTTFQQKRRHKNTKPSASESEQAQSGSINELSRGGASGYSNETVFSFSRICVCQRAGKRITETSFNDWVCGQEIRSWFFETIAAAGQHSGNPLLARRASVGHPSINPASSSFRRRMTRSLAMKTAFSVMPSWAATWAAGLPLTTNSQHACQVVG